jgi:hypothetical protein
LLLLLLLLLLFSRLQFPVAKTSRVLRSPVDPTIQLLSGE